MALRDQPYLPLYVKDIMTDEKLNECSAATHGVYIKGIMCLMHKSESYGKILLKQKYKQTESKEMNFALMLAPHLPYSVDIIFAALVELIIEQVCQFEEDWLVQKRMVLDGKLSVTRSLSGKKGGLETQKVNKNFALAKIEPTSVNEYAIVNEDNTLHNLLHNQVRLNNENFSKISIQNNGNQFSSPNNPQGESYATKRIAELLAIKAERLASVANESAIQDGIVSNGRI